MLIQSCVVCRAEFDCTFTFQIKRIKIGHDGSGVGAGWFLDEVRILIPSRGEQYVFACHRWLAVDEEDHQLEVELEPSYKEDMEKSKFCNMLVEKCSNHDDIPK